MYGIERGENAAIFGIKYPALQFALNAPSSETTEIEQEKMKMFLDNGRGMWLTPLQFRAGYCVRGL